MYFDHGGHPGSVVELVAPDEVTASLFAHIRRRAADWDGVTDPVRRPGR